MAEIRQNAQSARQLNSRHCTPKRLEKMLQQILRRHSAELKVVIVTSTDLALLHNAQHLRHHQTVYGSVRQLCDGLSIVGESP